MILVVWDDITASIMLQRSAMLWSSAQVKSHCPKARQHVYRKYFGWHVLLSRTHGNVFRTPDMQSLTNCRRSRLGFYCFNTVSCLFFFFLRLWRHRSGSVGNRQDSHVRHLHPAAVGSGAEGDPGYGAGSYQRAGPTGALSLRRCSKILTPNTSP